MYNSYELYHHGILGMKWGIRRTPAQLGYKEKQKQETNDKVKNIKNASKEEAKRLKVKYKNQAKIDKAHAKADAKAKALKQKYESNNEEKLKEATSKYDSKYGITRKKASEMTNQEIEDALYRKQKVDAYNKAFNPEKQSFAKEYAKSFGRSMLTEAVTPAIVNASKNYLEKKLNDALGLNVRDIAKELEREANISKYRANIVKNQYDQMVNTKKINDMRSNEPTRRLTNKELKKLGRK